MSNKVWVMSMQLILGEHFEKPYASFFPGLCLETLLYNVMKTVVLSERKFYSSAMAREESHKCCLGIGVLLRTSLGCQIRYRTRS